MPARRAPGGPPAATAGTALFVLRLFLGITFVYAGVQKLADPGYLHPGAPTYIGTQLHGFANGTPGGFLLRAFALPQPKLVGVAVALVEILIGLLTTAGLLTRVAAAGGLALNFVLFLTNSWHAYPYFLGSDIVFCFAWLPFVMAGASGQPALDHGLERLAQSPRMPLGQQGGADLTRRAVLSRALGIAGFAALGIGGIAALAKGPYKGGAKALGAAPNAGAAGHPAKHASGGASHHRAHPSSVPSNAVRLGKSSQLAPGQGASYRDPSDGSPDIVVRGSDGKLAAFSAVCTHAGCTVGYQGGQIVCPCHGGIYSARTGAVISGPPPQALATKHVIESNGSIYALPA